MKVIKFAPGLIPVLKHQEHDQSSHGNWAEGSQGTTIELTDDEIRDVIYNSKTVNEMFQKIAKRQGKSMKPSVDNLSEDEITHYRGVQDVTRDAQRLLDGKVKFTEFQTWGQGIYLAEEKDIASNYGTLIGMKLDSSAKIVQGETTWDSAFDVSYDNPSARTRNTTTSSFIDLARIETQIRAGKMDNLSISDMRNVYWAAKGYDGFTTYGETVLFNGSKLTLNKADIGTAVKKHGEHNQKTHGSWASGNYESLADWLTAEEKVFASDEEREEYFKGILFSQREKGFTELAHPEFSGAISNYEGRLGYDMNEALRDPQISEDGYKPTIDALDKAMEIAPPLSEEVVAYRGVKGNGLDFFDRLKVGDTWEDKGFTSTTIDPAIARRFGGEQPYYDGIIFRMKLPAGTKGIFPSGYHEPMYGWEADTSEAEFLMPRGSKFKVVAQRGKVWDVELVKP
jgi:hypothetical protein